VTTEPEGAELLSRAAAGDRGAFEAFVRRWEGPLFRFLVRTTGSADLADEARQLTFVRVLRRADSFRGGSVSSWLFKTASRIAIDLHRSETRRTAAPLEGDTLPAASADPADAAAASDERARVRAALAAMDADDRALRDARDPGGDGKTEVRAGARTAAQAAASGDVRAPGRENCRRA
jgi:RNA polymerase sigma-70 factor, ECF subfamily